MKTKRQKATEAMVRPMNDDYDNSYADKMILERLERSMVMPRGVYSRQGPAHEACRAKALASRLAHTALTGHDRFASNGACRACHSHKQSERYSRITFGVSRSEHHRIRGLACEICGESKRRRVLDHDHSKPGTFRGPLCQRCNALLGNVGDNVEILRRAMEYLNAHSNTGDSASGQLGMDPSSSGGKDAEGTGVH